MEPINDNYGFNTYSGETLLTNANNIFKDVSGLYVKQMRCNLMETVGAKIVYCYKGKVFELFFEYSNEQLQWTYESKITDEDFQKYFKEKLSVLRGFKFSYFPKDWELVTNTYTDDYHEIFSKIFNIKEEPRVIDTQIKCNTCLYEKECRCYLNPPMPVCVDNKLIYVYPYVLHQIICSHYNDKVKKY